MAVYRQHISRVSYPITLMLGPIEDLITKEKNRPEHEVLDQLELIHRNAVRLLKLVNTLLDFSSIEAGRMKVKIKTVVENLASVFRAACERAGLEYIVDCEDVEVPVYLDLDMFEKIILNIISNAYKFTLEGHIAVRLRAIGASAIQISVEDTGTGIPESELPKLFERFHRVPESKRRTHEGTGIGLAMVNELVKLHEGTIQAYSKYGTGSIFIVTIPTGFTHLPPDQVSQAAIPEDTRRPSYIQSEEWWIGNETAAITKRVTGLGLGLVISKALTNLMNGEISASSQGRNLGSTFKEVFPVLSQTRPTPPRELAVTQPIAYCVKEAQENKFNFVISDIGLPDGSSYDLMAKTKIYIWITRNMYLFWWENINIKGVSGRGFEKK